MFLLGIEIISRDYPQPSTGIYKQVLHIASDTMLAKQGTEVADVPLCHHVNAFHLMLVLKPHMMHIIEIQMIVACIFRQIEGVDVFIWYLTEVSSVVYVYGSKTGHNHTT